MNSETTSILGAQSSVTVIVQGQAGSTTTVAVKPAPHNIVMADMFSLKKRDYFDVRVTCTRVRWQRTDRATGRGLQAAAPRPCLARRVQGGHWGGERALQLCYGHLFVSAAPRFKH